MRPDAEMTALLDRELAGRSGAWITVHTHLPGADAGLVAHLQTLAASVATARDIGYFPAGPMYYAAAPGDVHQDSTHSRLAFVARTPERLVQAFMLFGRSGDVRTASVFRHDTPELGPHDLLLADAESLVVDVAGLSLGLARTIGYTGEVAFRLDVAAPSGGGVRLRAVDEESGWLRPAADCPTSFEAVTGVFPLPDAQSRWPELLHAAGVELAGRFGVEEPQLIPAPDVAPSFAEVLTQKVAQVRA